MVEVLFFGLVVRRYLIQYFSPKGFSEILFIYFRQSDGGFHQSNVQNYYRDDSTEELALFVKRIDWIFEGS
jgi:hypothetical protein